MNSNKTKQIKQKLSRVIRRKTNKVKKQVKNKMAKFRRKMRRLRYNRMAAALVKNFKKDFQVLAQTGNTMRVKGRDLVYSIPSNLETNNDTDIITVIPANPAYWTGTRVSAIAAGYQNYRPIKFNISYVPQCAVTQQGNVIAGTLWAMAPSKQNLQQTLRTSNGGMLTQCYNPKTSRVQLRGNLQFNLFRMGGKFDQESNPFIFVALSIATTDSNNNKIVPGYFYVTYEYEFKNPIGNTITYYNSNIVKRKVLDGYTNVSAINLQQNSAPLGAILQQDNQNYTYNDDTITLTSDSLLWYFANSDTSIKEEEEMLEVLGTKVGDNVITYDFGLSNTNWIIVTDHGKPDSQITAFRGGVNGATQYYIPITFKYNVDVWKLTDLEFQAKLNEPDILNYNLDVWAYNGSTHSGITMYEYELSEFNFIMKDDEEA